MTNYHKADLTRSLLSKEYNANELKTFPVKYINLLEM